MFIAMFFIAAIGTTKAQDAAMVAEIKKSLELQHTREVMVETMKLQYETLNNSGQVVFDDVKAMSEEIVHYDFFHHKILSVNSNPHFLRS